MLAEEILHVVDFRVAHHFVQRQRLVIARIENDLPPAVVIKGQAVRAMTLRERMQFYKVPGVSVAFFDHGKIIWTRAYGLADVATKKPVTPETLFQAASIGKPLSALAALHLVEEGKLSLDENVNDKLRTWKVPDNQFTTQEKGHASTDTEPQRRTKLSRLARLRFRRAYSYNRANIERRKTSKY